MVFFLSYVNVYQRVVMINGPMQTMVLVMTKATIFMCHFQLCNMHECVILSINIFQ